MNKLNKLIPALLALVVLALGGIWLLGPQGAYPAIPMSPLGTPKMDLTPTSHIAYVEQTPPSEDWPTLTPPPTWPVEPTPQGMPVIKPTPSPVPTFTPYPVLLTPIPEGVPSIDLTSLYYVADTDTGAELRTLEIDAQGRKWRETKPSLGKSSGSLVGLYQSPDGKYLASAFLADGYGEVKIMERSSGKVWCPVDEPAGCRGSFLGWLSSDQFLFQISDEPPEGVPPQGVIVVNLTTDQFSPVDLPTHPEWGYSRARNVSLYPSESTLAYSITYPEGGKEISEVWIMNLGNEEKQLLRKVDGLVKALSWSPIGDRLLYVYQGKSGHLPTELRVLNIERGNEQVLASNLPLPGERRYRPVWSPDGLSIAFVQLNEPENFYDSSKLWGNVWSVDVTTGKTTKLSAFEGREIGYPTWSPDGKFVAFVSRIVIDRYVHNPEVWVANADGTQFYAVSKATKWNNALTWMSPLSDSK